MRKLPRVSGKKFISALKKKDFEVKRQKGSRVFMKKSISEGSIITVVPNHKEIAKGAYWK
jgi:predicted RNA binding protein YcfA (HicA-like mRNA interferase family)